MKCYKIIGKLEEINEEIRYFITFSDGIQKKITYYEMFELLTDAGADASQLCMYNCYNYIKNFRMKSGVWIMTPQEINKSGCFSGFNISCGTKEFKSLNDAVQYCMDNKLSTSTDRDAIEGRILANLKGETKTAYTKKWKINFIKTELQDLT